MKQLILASILTILSAAPQVVLAAEKGKNPDFTKGEAIPARAEHDWNLGPTGMRGWMYCAGMATTEARQIAVTEVEKGSPSDGVMKVGDVILGVGGKVFSVDPRMELGKAITAAETADGGGKLAVTRWREGKSEEVVVPLPVLGSYGATAPFGCEKSKRLLELGCRALAARAGEAEKKDPIERSLNALALLASGEAEYLPLVKREVEWAAGFKARSMQTWYYGYVMILVGEYVLATGDETMLPGLRRLALEAAKGQSAVGSWGHGFAKGDGRLGGYGMMNSPGLPLTIGLVLAREAGVKEPEVGRAIELSARLLWFYIGKGAIPYGDHHPWIQNHDDNGKCGMAAVLFNLLGETKGAEFFSRMSVASHGAERDTGHTGNFFNMLWAMPGVVQSGPMAAGAWMREFGGWYCDLARRWDGAFPHQGPPETERDSYAGWDATGGYLLAYAMPLKKIYLTGKRPGGVPQLDAEGAEALVRDGRGWSDRDRYGVYEALNNEELMKRLGSWSPVVRERAAKAVGRRKDMPVDGLVKMLEGPGLEMRYGACEALSALGGRGAAGVEGLRKLLSEDDLWLRIQAAEALAAIGKPAAGAVPQLLELLAQVDAEKDPRGMQQRYLSFALFDTNGEHGNGMLSRSLDGVDREALYKAVRAGLKNQDGRARGAIGSVYRNLSTEEIRPLLPAIYEAIAVPAPSGEMFADSIRVEGLRLLAKHRIVEGIGVCVQYTREQNPWDSQERTPVLMKVLLTYGTHAKAVIPELTKIANYFANDEKDFPRELMRRKAKCVRETIAEIEASTETPELVRLKDGEG